MTKNISINKIILFLFILSSLIVNINFIFFDSFINAFQKFIIIGAIILSFSAPSIFYYFNNSKYNHLPMVEIILLFFLFSYLGIFFFSTAHNTNAFFWFFYDTNLENQNTFLNIFKNPFFYLKYYYYSMLGFLLAYIIFYFSFSKKMNIFSNNFRNKFLIKNEDNYFILGTILFSVKITIFILPELLFYNIVHQFKNVIFFLFVICYSNFLFIAKKKILKKLLIILFLTLIFFIDISETGSQVGVTLMLMLLVLNYWLINKKIFVIGIILLVLNFYFFQDIKINYRQKVHETQLSLRKPFYKISNYKDTLTENIKLLSDNDFDNKNRVSTARLTITSVGFNKILDLYKKNKLDLKQGETYKPLIFFFIPRLIWPNKPSSSFGVEYGKITNLTGDPKKLDNVSNATSINLAWISESFLNFGKFTFIPMFLKGLLISFFSFFIFYREKCLLFSSWLAAISPLMLPESNFAIMISPIFYHFIFLMLITFTFKYFFKR